MTSRKVLMKVDSILPKDLDGNIYELGSGFGRLLYYLSHKFSKSSILGYEGARIPYIASLFFLKIRPRRNVSLLHKDFTTVSLQNASLVTCYLYPKIMPKLKAKFEKELPKGCYILSHTFAIPGWRPKKTLIADDIYNTEVYLYQQD